MDYPWAVVGAKVVCVDESFPYRDSPLRAGEVYTIKCIHVDSIVYPLGCYPNCPVKLRLDGVINPYDYLGDGSFAIKRFRPLRSTEIGMSILRGLTNLTPEQVREVEDA